MCMPVLLLVVEAELPPLENYLHEGQLEVQDVCIHCIAAIKRLGVWLHWVDMTTQYNKARANSPCSDDHKLGTLLDFSSDTGKHRCQFKAHHRPGGG